MNPTSMEEKIEKQYNLHFNQANTTMVAQEFMMGRQTEEDLYENFGDNRIPDIGKGLKKLFGRTTQEEINTTISPEEFRIGIKKGKKRRVPPHRADIWDTTTHKFCHNWMERRRAGRNYFSGFTAPS